MKQIIKGNYVRIEGEKEWAWALFNEDGIIYLNYGEMPYIDGDTGVSERLGHFVSPEGYPKTLKELTRILREWCDIKDFAKKLGRRGGETTLKRYGKEKMTEWGKRGGRPKTK